MTWILPEFIMTTTFSTVIVTRNRPLALALSLPLHLMQSRLPERVLIIDSSDDPSQNRALVARLSAGSPLPLDHQTSAPGSSLQRNIGLSQITSDVVFFPDDDSLVYPEALARMMQIYDLDTRGRIGGVCAVEAASPPPGVLDGQDTPYQRRRSDAVRARIAPLRMKLEHKVFPDPMKLAAQRLQRDLAPPEAWLASQNAAWVEWMTGFRMSFRTDLVRRVGFNEQLGRYALYEDIDAGLGVMAGGHSLVATSNARIYHHKAPDSRASGHQMGAINILNRAYVALRCGRADGAVKASILPYARFRLAQFAAGARGDYGRERLAGARAATRVLPDLLNCPADEMDGLYLRLRNQCLASAA